MLYLPVWVAGEHFMVHVMAMQCVTLAIVWKVEFIRDMPKPATEYHFRERVVVFCAGPALPMAHSMSCIWIVRCLNYQK